MPGAMSRRRLALVLLAGLALPAGPDTVRAQEPAVFDSWHHRALDEGEALYSLGRRHAEGRGVPRDDGAAFGLYRRAAEAGHPGAQHALGRHFRDGRGVAADPAQAALWFRRAAEAGEAGAAADLAALYLEGSGVPRDDAAAARWFQTAGQRGHGPARLALAASFS